MTGAMPQPIYDAWQRGVAIPGLPPPPIPLSPEKRRELEERRRHHAKVAVEEWRRQQSKIGEKWVDQNRWFARGDPPPAFYRLMTKGPSCLLYTSPSPRD